MIMPTPPLMKEQANLPPEWEGWCHRGRHTVGNRRRAVLRSLDKDGKVRGYYSKLLFNPKLDPANSLYPSAEHISSPKDDTEMVVEARIINDMKSHLSEDEFWCIIEHLYVVGVDEKKIATPPKRRDDFSPKRHY